MIYTLMFSSVLPIPVSTHTHRVLRFAHVILSHSISILTSFFSHVSSSSRARIHIYIVIISSSSGGPDTHSARVISS